MPTEEQTQQTHIALIEQSIVSINSELVKINSKLDTNATLYVQKTEFELRVGRIEKVVYGACGLILVGAISAGLLLIWKMP